MHSVDASKNRPTHPLGPTTRWLGLDRSELLALAYILTTTNALLPLVLSNLQTNGLVYSILNTLDISAIVWGGIALGIGLVLRDRGGEVSPWDKAVFVGSCLVNLAPLGSVSWVSLAALSLYGIMTSPRDTYLHRAGWVFLALTVPMFWSKRLFNLFANVFLSIDAVFVSTVTQSERIGNLVKIPNGPGYLQISAPCSSMANVSLAVLCWVLFTQYHGLRWRPVNIAWCLGACLTVLLINVTRISLIGFFPNHYELLHGAIGAMVVSWLDVIAVSVVCYFGVSHGRNVEIV